MTSASHVATGATGATNVVVDTVPDKQVPARIALTSSQDQQMGPNLVQVQHTVGSEQSDLSDDEFSVLEVQLKQSGEFSKGSPSSAGSHTPNMSNNVWGRLKQHIAFWERIEAPSFILDTIREGYKIPFKFEPPRSFKPNNHSAKSHGKFVSDSIKELLASDRFSEAKCSEKLHVINPLSVSVQSSGKKRLILDLRVVNACLYKRKVKFDDHNKALDYFTLNGFLIKFDLKSGYHHLDIFPAHRKFLGYSWAFEDGVPRFFQFNVLPFGLSTAPYIFTKLLRPLVKLWRRRGFHSVIYLDDGIGLEETYEKAEYAAHHTHADLYAAGFIVADEKSVWQPTHVIEWFGLTWDAKAGNLAISDKRISKATKLLRTAAECPIHVGPQTSSFSWIDHFDGGCFGSFHSYNDPTLSNYSSGCGRLGYKTSIRQLLSFRNTVLVRTFEPWKS